MNFAHVPLPISHPTSSQQKTEEECSEQRRQEYILHPLCWSVLGPSTHLCLSLMQPTPGAPPFLKNLSEEDITEHISQMHRDLLALRYSTPGTEGDGVRIQHAKAHVTSFSACVQDGPLEAQTMFVAHTALGALDTLYSHSNRAHIRIQYARVLIMKTTRDLWRWIEVAIPNAVRDHLNETAPLEYGWLRTLVSDVGRAMVDPMGSQIQFQCPVLGSPPITTLPTFATGVLIADRIRIGTCSIIRQWLNYPPPSIGLVQAQFIHALLRDTDEGVLFLPHVWKTFLSATQRSCQGILGATDWSEDKITDALPNHPLYDNETRLRRQLCQISEIVTQFAREDGHPGYEVTDAILAPITNARQETYQWFMEKSHHVIHENGTLPDIHLQTALTIEGDCYNPFREDAPTRVRMRGPDGPLNADRDRQSGIFSALVCRGITFNTEFSRTGRMYFTSVDDFAHACFGNPETYGTLEPGRCIELADTYWTSLKQHWDEVPSDNWDPVAALEFFRASDVDIDPQTGAHNVHKRFPQLGVQTSYLLVCDLIYGAVVNPFTTTQMVRNVCEINKGAVKGLDLLGLLPTRLKNAKPTEEDCEEGLRTAMGLVQAAVPTEKIVFDDITLEHSLCNLAKLWKILERH
jgi:hypothetical protein